MPCLPKEGLLLEYVENSHGRRFLPVEKISTRGESYFQRAISLPERSEGIGNLPEGLRGLVATHVTCLVTCGIMLHYSAFKPYEQTNTYAKLERDATGLLLASRPFGSCS